MRRLFLLTISLILAMGASAPAITQEEAARMVDTAFARQFGSHYEHNVIFFDGAAFRTAYALARSGSVSSGGCGYNLVNTCIAVTFDLATDSLGASDEGTTILKLNPPAIPTLDSALMMVNRFLEQTVEGPAGVGGEVTFISNKAKSVLRVQSPNDGGTIALFSGNGSLPVGTMASIYLINGALACRAEVQKNMIKLRRPLSSGSYLLVVEAPGGQSDKRLVGLFIVIR